MNSLKEMISQSNRIRNGVIGFISGICLFIPNAFLTHYLWAFIYEELLNKHLNTNTDSYMLVFICFPITVVTTALGGILGGAIGLNLSHMKGGESVGSILGGVLAGLVIAGLMTQTVVSEWAT